MGFTFFSLQALLYSLYDVHFLHLMEKIVIPKSELDKNLQRIEYLESQSEELSDFIENANLPLHWVNGSGIIVWVNKAELDFLGYRKDEFLGKHISNFHADREVIEDILSRLMDKETLFNFPARLLCKNGDVKEVLINSNVFWKDDKIIHSRCFITDVTVLKKEDARKAGVIVELEEKLKITEQRYSKMTAEVEDYAIILLDRDGTILNWNKGAQKIKGYAAKDIIGQNFRIFYLPQDRQSKLPEKLIEEAIINGRALHEGLRVRSDGTTFWGTIVITALHDDLDNVIGFTKVTRNLTEREAARKTENKTETGRN